MTKPVAEKDRWLPITAAPFDCDLQLAVLNYDGVNTLVSMPTHAGRLDKIWDGQRNRSVAHPLA